MKIYALLSTIGSFPAPKFNVYAVTRANTLEQACKKFRVVPVDQRYGFYRERAAEDLPLPPKAADPEFIQVETTEASAAEVGHTLTIPRLFSFMQNAGAWVCELPVVD